MSKKYNKRKPVLIPGTDPIAFKKGAKGKTPAERSEIYHREKQKNEKKEFWKSFLGSGVSRDNQNTRIINPPTQRVVQTKKSVKKYHYKKTILDGLRDYRSSAVVSNISNVLATFIVKTTGQGLDNKSKNILRATIAFVSSEVFNKIFEEELETIERVKLFIKIGKTVYRIGVWLDERDNSIKFNENKIRQVSTGSWGYKAFLRKHPTISSYYNALEYCLSKEEILNGKKCERKLVLEDKAVEQNSSEVAPNFCEYYYYCHGIKNEEK